MYVHLSPEFSLSFGFDGIIDVVSYNLLQSEYTLKVFDYFLMSNSFLAI